MAKPTRRRMRPHGTLPSGFQWRDGRPAWIPSPARRKQGWKRCDLRDAWGKYVDKPTAIARAEKIAAAVAAWASGEPVPAAYASFAPPGALDHGATRAELSPRSIATLLNAYYENPDFCGGGKIKGLAPKTQSDYRSKIKRFLEVVASRGDKGQLLELEAEQLERRMVRLQALDVDIFLPPAFGEPGEPLLSLAYKHLREVAGEHMAYGALAAVSAWMGWMVREKRVWPTNPALLVNRSTPDGRLRVATWEELRALVAAAWRLGFASIADAIILGVDLSWSEQDILALRWDQVRDGRIRHRRIKTGNAGNPPLLSIGREQLAAIEERRRGSKVEALHHIVVCETTGRPWRASHFQHTFALVRAAAVAGGEGQAPCPSASDLRYQDLRDTCVTLCVDAGLSVEEVCSRTLHTVERAEAIIFKHYGSIRQVVADRGGARLQLHFDQMGYRFGAA